MWIFCVGRSVGFLLLASPFFFLFAEAYGTVKRVSGGEEEDKRRRQGSPARPGPKDIDSIVMISDWRPAGSSERKRQWIFVLLLFPNSLRRKKKKDHLPNVGPHEASSPLYLSLSLSLSRVTAVTWWLKITMIIIIMEIKRKKKSQHKRKRETGAAGMDGLKCVCHSICQAESYQGGSVRLIALTLSLSYTIIIYVQ